MASFVLWTWASGNWLIGTLGYYEYIPMAPSTALLVILFSAAVLSRIVWPAGRYSLRLAYLAVTIVFGACIFMYIRFLFSVYVPQAEEYLSSLTERITGRPLGLLAPLSLTMFQLTVVAFLLELAPFNRSRFLRQAAPLLAMVVFLTTFAIVISYLVGSPVLYGSSATPMALPTALCLMLLCMALSLNADPGTWPVAALKTGNPESYSDLRMYAYSLTATFVFLFVSMGVICGFYLERQSRAMEQAAQKQLDAIADLKTSQIVDWRRERLDDARFLKNCPFVARDIQTLLREPDSESARTAIIGWLVPFTEGESYEEAAILDRHGNRLLAVPAAGIATASGDRELLAGAAKADDVTMTDFEEGGTSGTHIDILIPVNAPPGEGANGPSVGEFAGAIAVIMLRIDPHKVVFPLIQTWPTPSPTAETMLLREEKGYVVALNDLRHWTAASPEIRLPIGQYDLPPQLARNGQKGIVEGLDYRGVPAVAAVHSVPGTNWLVAAKVDRAEIYAPSRQQLVQAASIIALLVLIAGLSVAMLWRRRSLAFLYGALALERERGTLAQRFEHLMKHANDIILLAAEDGSIREANDRAVESYGSSLPAMRRMRLSDLCAPAALAESMRRTKELKAAGSTLYESVHRRADGSTFNVEVSGSAVDIGGETCLLVMVRDISERERAAEALRASEQNFRTLFDSIRDFFFVVDRAGNVLQVNKTVITRLGYTKEELTGKSLLFLHPEESRAEAARNLEDMASGKTDHCSVPLVTRGGDHIPVETYIVSGLWSGQEVLFGVSRDISALRASEEKFVKIFKTSPALMAISTVDDGRYLEVNETFLKTLGYEREEVVGKTSIELNVFKDPNQRGAIKKIVFETGMLRNYEVVVRRKDGQFRVGLFSADVIEVRGERLLQTVMNDVTDLKRAEEALLRLGRAVDSASDAIGISDANGVHIYQNKGFTDMFGYTVEELGSSSGPMVVYCDPAKGREIFDIIMRGDSWRGEAEMIAKDGRQFTVSMQADVIRDEQGNITSLIGVHRDVTKQKRQEEERQQLLDQTQRDARIKAELLAEVNHRVKNNLTSILGLLLGEKQFVSDQNRAPVAAVLDSLALRIRGLLQVHQMLSDAHWSPMRLNELADRVIRAALVAVPRGRQVSVTLKPSTVQISPRQAGSMALVLNELAVNTAKHAMQDRAEASIIVGVTREGSGIRLEYRDDGPGYPEAVFHDGGGSVGMHLVRQLVSETLRGTVSLYNDDGAVAVLCIRTEDTRHT